MTGFFHIHLFIFGVCQAAPVAKCIFLGDGAGANNGGRSGGPAEGRVGSWLAESAYGWGKLASLAQCYSIHLLAWLAYLLENAGLLNPATILRESLTEPNLYVY